MRMLCDGAELAARMAANGLTGPAAEKKAVLFAGCAKTLQKHGLVDEAEVKCFFVPGRIEVLGKHTDYAGGGVVPSCSKVVQAGL